MIDQIDEHHYSRRGPRLSAPRSSIVLVAEDDALMRSLLTRALVLDGFRVVDASDGAELDAWIRRLVVCDSDHRCVDLIIADQRMPEATGLEVLSHLRRVDWSTPFILITAFGDTNTHAEAARLGASCVLDKPFDFTTLRAVALKYALPRDA
jgi:DNA-binding response OmpR family regulator